MDIRDMQVVNDYGDRFGMNEHGVAYVAVSKRCGRCHAVEVHAARTVLHDELQARRGESLPRSIWSSPAKVGTQDLDGITYVVFEEGEDPEND